MSSNSKGGGSTASNTYNYFGSLASVHCHGPLDEIFGIEVDDDLVWTGSILRADSPNPVTISIPGRGIARLYWGTEDQLTPDPILSASGNSLGHQHPAYTGIVYVVLVDFLFGRERTFAPSIRLHGRRKPVQTLITGSAANLIDNNANPFCVLAELLTRPRIGREVESSRFVSSQWQAAANAAMARASECYISPFISAQENGFTLARNIVTLCDGFFRMEFGTGLLEAGMLPKPETINPSLLPNITTAMLESRPSWSPQSWSDITTRTVVRFTDRAHNFKERSVKYDDPRARITGEIRVAEVNAGFINRENQATQLSRELGRRSAIPGLSGEVPVRPAHAATIQPGHRIRLDIDPEPGGISLEQVCRVLRVSRSPLGATRLSVESERTLAPVLVAAPPDIAPPETITVPDIAHARLFEVPPPLAEGLNYAVGILASRPDPLVTSCAALYDTADTEDSTFPPLGSHRNYALRAKLTASYSSSATGALSVQILDAINREIIAENPGDISARNNNLLLIVFAAPEVSGAEFRQPLEIFSVAEMVSTGTDLLSVTALRARVGTLAIAHAANAEAWFIPREVLPWYRHEDFPVRANASQPLQFKLQPATFQASRPLEDCAVREFVFDTLRPYAPKITIQAPTLDAGESYASVVTTGRLNISGRVTDADSNLIQVQLIRSFGGAETPLMDRVFDPSAETAFSQNVGFPDAGLTIIIIRARDTTGQVVEKRLVINVGTASPTSLSVVAPAAPGTAFEGTGYWHGENSDPDAEPPMPPAQGTVFAVGGTGPFTMEIEPIHHNGLLPEYIPPSEIYPGEEWTSTTTRASNSRAWAINFRPTDNFAAGRWADYRFKVTDSLGTVAYSEIVFVEVFNTWFAPWP